LEFRAPALTSRNGPIERAVLGPHLGRLTGLMLLSSWESINYVDLLMNDINTPLNHPLFSIASWSDPIMRFLHCIAPLY
jgi:hypothetical protein